MLIRRLLFSVILVMIIGSSFFSKTASSQQVDFRVNNLESDMRRLELRLNQIELLLSQNRQFSSPKITPTPSPSTGTRRTLSQSERDKMFDRLSTLVVELKQQVNQLTTRVSKLESR
ncbi:hypothetical protein H6G68_23220 [Anabaena catenula FACHB-362]|uniref:Uncharacterized protein n=1 Tax=Anabaena catenula FACHB-362 TaxID=2692877 RepID=A0ABR8J8D1_9NOST|nr:hypothetical protein [Anabaena catenula]MBD2694622.1 hypothetical protein [Anabaena catenula FACHB-362]